MVVVVFVVVVLLLVTMMAIVVKQFGRKMRSLQCRLTFSSLTKSWI